MEEKNIVYGRNPVFEYLKNSGGNEGLELFINKKAHGKIIDLIIKEADNSGVFCSYVDKDFFRQLGPSSVHQGVLLKVPGLARATGKNQILKEAAENNGILVLLDHLNDPHNIGSIIRTSEALGASGIILTRSNSPGLTSTVVKSSAGATAHIDILNISNISGFLGTAKDLGFWIIGTSADGDTDLSKIHELRPAILIIGNEGEGIRNIVMKKCDFLYSIPLSGEIKSLNASVAAGIIMYQMTRRQE